MTTDLISQKKQKKGRKKVSELFSGAVRASLFPRSAAGTNRQIEVQLPGQTLDPRLIALRKTGRR